MQWYVVRTQRDFENTVSIQGLCRYCEDIWGYNKILRFCEESTKFGLYFYDTMGMWRYDEDAMRICEHIVWIEWHCEDILRIESNSNDISRMWWDVVRKF